MKKKFLRLLILIILPVFLVATACGKESTSSSDTTSTTDTTGTSTSTEDPGGETGGPVTVKKVLNEKEKLQFWLKVREGCKELKRIELVMNSKDETTETTMRQDSVAYVDNDYTAHETMTVTQTALDKVETNTMESFGVTVHKDGKSYEVEKEKENEGPYFYSFNLSETPEFSVGGPGFDYFIKNMLGGYDVVEGEDGILYILDSDTDWDVDFSGGLYHHTYEEYFVKVKFAKVGEVYRIESARMEGFTYVASTTTGARPKIETMQVEEEHEASGTFTYGTKGAYAGKQELINSFPDKYMQRTNFHIQAYSATFDEEGNLTAAYEAYERDFTDLTRERLADGSMNFEHYKDINLDHEYVYRVLSSEAVNAWNDELELETFYSDGSEAYQVDVDKFEAIEGFKKYTLGDRTYFGVTEDVSVFIAIAGKCEPKLNEAGDKVENGFKDLTVEVLEALRFME
ncbi:MAG: hypothetical protein ACOX0I_02870 [Bacilli bacterium]|jgi:hypothetical protein